MDGLNNINHQKLKIRLENYRLDKMTIVIYNDCTKTVSNPECDRYSYAYKNIINLRSYI